MTIQRLDCGSAANGELAEGCKLCTEGAKMVLFVTGRCRAGCYYCPVSAERKGRDVIYADEGRAMTDDDVLAEAEAMDALGTGITGGDPSENLDRTEHFIRLLRQHFGPRHHIHLYTSVINLTNAKRLETAGLDEIRYHPREELWRQMDRTELKDIVAGTGMDVGLEVPALPGRNTDLNILMDYAAAVGVKFVNLNELEFSESNWSMMSDHNYEVKDELASAVKGSEETALAVLSAHPDQRIHFCSSSFKDGVQLRHRLHRRAEHIAKEYDVVTPDGTLIKGLVYADDLAAAADYLRQEYEVPDSLMHIDGERHRLEVASWVLEEVGKELPFKCYVVEEYPTADRLEVERTPLN
ncbi:MAG: radical SAM protein [Methanomethylophilus sp.]